MHCIVECRDMEGGLQRDNRLSPDKVPCKIKSRFQMFRRCKVCVPTVDGPQLHFTNLMVEFAFYSLSLKLQMKARQLFNL